MRAVNLLPKEEGRGEGAGLRAPLVAGGAGALVVAAAIGALTYSENSKLRDGRAELETLRIQLAATPRPAAPPAWQSTIQDEEARRASALAAALGHRVGWERIVQELASVLPREIWLTHIEGKSPDPAAAPAAGTAPADLMLEGAAGSHADVARLLARLAVVPDFTSVTLRSSSTQTGAADQLGRIGFRVDIGLRAPEAAG